jgi:AAT family amino acid transporter
MFPFSSYITLAFLIGVVGVMAYFPETRIALIVGPAWYLILVIFYFAKGLHKRPHGEAAQTENTP